MKKQPAKKQPAKSKRQPASKPTKKKQPESKIRGKKSELTVFEFAPLVSVASFVTPQESRAFDPEYVFSQLNTYYGRRRMCPAYALIALAVGAIRELKRLTQEDLPGVSRAAAGRVTWPVLAGRHTALSKRNEALFEQIGLGRESLTPLDFGAVPIDLTPAKKWALELLQLVEHIRFQTWCSEIMWQGKPSQMTDEHMQRLLRNIPASFTQALFPSVKVNWALVFEIGKLPELTPNEKSIQAWEDAVGNLLVLNFDEHPEDIPDLCALGEHRRYHPILKTVMNDDMAKHFVSPERQRKNIVREVRSKIKEEICKIAKHIEKLKPPTE